MASTKLSAAVAALTFVFLFALGGLARAQTFPAPTDEAALYAGAQKEGTLVWYGGAPMQPMRDMADDFQKKYPGVKIQIIRIIGAEQYQRFMTETQAKQYIVDILHIGDKPSMDELVANGYIANWKVPTFDRLPADGHVNDQSYAAWINDVDIAYNSKKVTPEEVKLFENDWHGLLDPRFKNRLATTDQPCGVCYSWLQMMLSPKYKDTFGLKYLHALAAQHLAVYGDVTIPVDRIIAGDQDIYIMSGEGVNYSKYLQGAPIRWVHPSPIPAYGNTWFGIPKTATHPYAARLFLNWILSDDGANAIHNKYGGLTMLQGVPDTRSVTKEPWYHPITDRYVPDWTTWSDDFDKNWTMWTKMLRAGG